MLKGDKSKSELREGALWLSIVSQLFTSRMNALLAPHEMTFTQFSVLNHLLRVADGDGQQISGVAKAVEAQQPAVTKIVAKFLKLGWVESMEIDGDRRTKKVKISDHGRSALLAIQADIGKDLSGIFGSLEGNELTAFVSSLKKIGMYLDQSRK